MIVKQTPDDFQVEELTDVRASAGPFALYRLEKRGWTTHDALQAVRRRWKIDHRRLSYGGLKDRHAHTSQHFTILRGPQRRLTHQGVSVTYLGQVPEPFTAEHIRANRFRIVLRDLTSADLAAALQALAEAAAAGVPNYFDDQRFGSVSGGGTFMAKAIIQGRYEEALRLALAAPYEHDRRPQKKEKAILRAHWGDWATCQAKLPPGQARTPVDRLVTHPDDFRGALASLRPELRGLYLSAYQSHLWNRMLALWLRAHVPAEQLLEVPLKLGPVPMHRFLDQPTLDQLRSLDLPLHGHRVQLEDNDPRKPYFDQVLREEDLTLDQFKLTGFKEIFFSRGSRAALCELAEIVHTHEPDESQPGRTKLSLGFTLPRGSYATLLIKRLSP